jgi:hypothetical protein
MSDYREYPVPMQTGFSASDYQRHVSTISAVPVLVFNGSLNQSIRNHAWFFNPNPINMCLKIRQFTLYVGTSVADPECLSRIRLFSIPDPGSELSPSQIRIREFKYFNPKKTKKMVSKL